MINARAETVAEKLAYGRLLKSRRRRRSGKTGSLRAADTQEKERRSGIGLARKHERPPTDHAENHAHARRFFE